METHMCHVLIIEDDWLIADHLAYLAQTAGATSSAIADTQDEAVRCAAECPPDVILSDVNLLEGTGPCAVAAILAALGHVPVIFITATPADCEPCEPPGVILTKPVDAARLVETFRRLAPA